MSPSPLNIARPAISLRIRVHRFDNTHIYGVAETDEKRQVRLRYALDNDYGDWSVLREQLQKGCTLQAVEPKMAEDNSIEANLYIFEPDLLADISAVASCFDTGSPQQLFISRFRQPPASNPSILLGNFASQLLDDILARPLNPPSYADSIRRFVRRNALAFAAAEGLGDFHSAARHQRDNIIQAVRNGIAANAPAFRADKALLEPTFFCPLLGLQGRMDLLQDDAAVLVEQKSGQKDWRGGHRLPHFVQMLLYQAVLHFGFGTSEAATATFLFYSKYTDSLIREHTVKPLLGDALRMRNAIVADDLALTTAEGVKRLTALSPDALRNNPSISERFWQQWKRPEIASVLDAIQQAPPLERAYFLRFLRFLSVESLLARTELAKNGRESMAALWLSSPEEQSANGNLLFPLHLEYRQHDDDGAVSALHLSADGEVLATSNFREGDTAIIFSTDADNAPDVRRCILWRGHISELRATSLTFCLRNPQQNCHPFSDERRFAIVHDPAEMSRPLLRGLFSFLTCPASRRDLLLSRRKPNLTEDKEQGGATDDITMRIARAARRAELFLLIGPPGSGKTSLGLMAVLTDTLSRTDDAILLTAYTNRAVDEICSKLIEAKLTFLRIGGERHCPKACQPYLLSHKAENAAKLDDVRDLIAKARIVVGTASALSSASHLFAIKSFGLCIADEASQLLEPHILPLFCATCPDGTPAVRRFVLIGDHRQLPAVVRQDRALSAEDTASLRAIGLTDCRESLFQRLLRSFGEDSPFVLQMEEQGRMHPDVADFPSTAFYGGRLVSAGLLHQKLPLPFVFSKDTESQLTGVIANSRFHFFNVHPDPDRCTPRSNAAEAEAAAEICAAWYKLWIKAGQTFHTEKSLGVIVPYRSQITLVRAALLRLASDMKNNGTNADALPHITIDTVERFQGSQREAIVYCFTASTPAQLAFLTAETFTDTDGRLIDRKLNVALTRARLQCFMTGNASLLSTAPLTASLIAHCREHNSFTTI